MTHDRLRCKHRTVQCHRPSCISCKAERCRTLTYSVFPAITYVVCGCLHIAYVSAESAAICTPHIRVRTRISARESNLFFIRSSILLHRLFELPTSQENARFFSCPNSDDLSRSLYHHRLQSVVLANIIHYF